MTDTVEPGRTDTVESDEHDRYDYEATVLSIGELRSALLRPDIAIEIPSNSGAVWHGAESRKVGDDSSK